jgi:rhodanese-related sulfurtransferase
MMATTATREDVRRLQVSGAPVVEVLPRPEYHWKHIAGAINLPLKELDEATANRLDRGRPVVVYCHDLQ